MEAPPEEAAPPRKRPSKKPQAEGGVPAQGGEEPAAKKKRIRPKSTEGAAEGERAAKAVRGGAYSWVGVATLNPAQNCVAILPRLFAVYYRRLCFSACRPVLRM